MGESLQTTLQETALNLHASVDETADKVASSMEQHTEQIQLVIDAIRSIGGTSANLHKKMSELETKLERMDELERRLKKLEEAS